MTNIVRKITSSKWFYFFAFGAGIWIVSTIMRETLHKRNFFLFYPRKMKVHFDQWLTDLIHWVNDAATVFGLFTVKSVFRLISDFFGLFTDFTYSLLVTGFDALSIPAMPWIAVVLTVGLLGYRYAGRKLSLMLMAFFTYLALFGMWELSMKTLSLVMVIVPMTSIFGLFIGIYAAKSPRFENAITPIMDIMQATPHFAYLVVIVILFGSGSVPALVATMIFAIPCMIRVTILGLRRISPDIVSAGQMSGCTPRQLLWKVKLPAAKRELLLGVNQVTMQTLAMIVIAAFIGAPGLGDRLLIKLNSLKLGGAMEIGVAIVILAVSLDRLTQAMAYYKKSSFVENQTIFDRHNFPLMLLGSIVGLSLIGWIFPVLTILPKEYTITTAPFWDASIDYFVLHMYDSLQTFKVAMLKYFLLPIRNFLQWVPWPVMIGTAVFVTWRLGGWKKALIVACFAAFPLVAGLWKQTMLTLYMIGSAVIICIAIGLPLGVIASRTERGAKIANSIADFMQTFPSFIYLIPVIMLFKVGDVSAIIAVMAYAAVPMMRYTILGLRGVPANVMDASNMIGMSKLQQLRKVQLPLAFPEIMLGVNQTILMGLAMVAITSYIGTRDLGERILYSLSNPDKAGLGVIAGLSIAAIGLIADKIITSWVAKRKAALGQK